MISAWAYLYFYLTEISVEFIVRELFEAQYSSIYLGLYVLPFGHSRETSSTLGLLSAYQECLMTFKLILEQIFQYDPLGAPDLKKHLHKSRYVLD